MRDIKWAVLGTGGIANEIKKLYKTGVGGVMIEYKEFGVEEIVRGLMSCNIAIINVNK